MGRQRCAILAIVAAAALAASSRITNTHDWGDDFAGYLMQAESVANGTADEFVRMNSFTMRASTMPPGPTTYPWGFPLLLSPLYVAFGFNIAALKIPNVIFFCGFLLALHALYARPLGGGLSLLLVALFALNPSLLSFSNQILSDIPFLFFSTLSLLLMERFVVSYAGRRRDRLIGVSLIGLSCALSASIRTNGILLLPALLCAQAARLLVDGRGNPFRLREQILPIVLPYFVFGALTSALNASLPQGSPSHLSFVNGINRASLATNIDYYAVLLCHFFDGVHYTQVAYGIFLPFLVLGLAQCERRDCHLVVYAIATFALYTVWPYHQGLRFLFPVLPLYAYFVLRGLLAAHTALRRRYRAAFAASAGVACALVMALFVRSTIAAAIKSNPVEGPFDAASSDMFQFVSHNTSPTSVIVFFKPRLMRMLTGRPSIAATRTSEIARGEYLVLHKLADDEYQMSKTDTEAKALLCRMYENERFTVYRIAGGRPEELTKSVDVPAMAGPASATDHPSKT